MFRLDSKCIPLLGGVTALVAAGLYVIWGPSERKRPHKKETCPGLVNVGNSCFLNALLQALAPCTTIKSWLNTAVVKVTDSDGAQRIATVVSNVLKVLNNQSIEFEEEFCPQEVLDALRARHWVITSEEQDAHELFHVLTETLEEETCAFQNILPLFNASDLQGENQVMKYQPSHKARSRVGGKLLCLPDRDEDYPFRGLLANQLCCQFCGFKNPVKYDTFDSLSLTIPSEFTSKGALTLHHLLKKYITPESVQSVECLGCARKQHKDGLLVESKPKPKTTFMKKVTIGKLPQCMCFHIQRKVWVENGMPIKRYDHVNFSEVLYMDDYVFHKKPQRPQTLMPSRELRLVGGRTRKNGFTQVNAKKVGVVSPTVTVPYSGPVNLLKALNYHSRVTTMSGLLVQSTTRRPDSGVGNNLSNSSVVQQLAQKYSTEVSSNGCNNAFKLTSVVVHMGDVFSGHFVTYRRAPSTNGQRFPDKWFFTSDTTVYKVPLSKVLQANAYMLFYERI